MTVDPKTSLRIILKELDDCQREIEEYGWDVSKIDEKSQSFTVRMKSPIDEEEYILEVGFENYKEWPLYLEFIDPETGEKGTKNAYPGSGRMYGGFFHGNPCICNPCSRKAYKGYMGLHTEWTLAGWQQNEKIGGLTNLMAILTAIYTRISRQDIYGGRMH